MSYLSDTREDVGFEPTLPGSRRQSDPDCLYDEWRDRMIDQRTTGEIEEENARCTEDFNLIH